MDARWSAAYGGLTTSLEVDFETEVSYEIRRNGTYRLVVWAAVPTAYKLELAAG